MKTIVFSMVVMAVNVIALYFTTSSSYFSPTNMMQHVVFRAETHKLTDLCLTGYFLQIDLSIIIQLL